MLKIIVMGGSQFNWWMRTTPQISFEECNYIDRITADGEELDYILTRAKNIPFVPGASSMTWYGDMASFIVTNIIGYSKE